MDLAYSTSVKKLILWALLAQAGDISSTLAGLHRGCQEAVWPYSRAPYVGVAAKGAGAVYLGFTLPLKGHPRASRVIATVSGLSGSLATAWNLHEMRSCR